MLRLMSTAAALTTIAAAPALADPAPYSLDAAHTEVLFTWSHGGFSETRGIFFGAEGEVMYDDEEPANSSVSISIPMENLAINADLRDHLMSGDFFGDNSSDPVTFESTSIEVTGEDTANITGDLTLNGTTNEVVLETVLNQQGQGPQGNEVIGFAATTSFMRSDYGLGAFTPFIEDEIDVTISLEASPAG